MTQEIEPIDMWVDGGSRGNGTDHQEAYGSILWIDPFERVPVMKRLVFGNRTNNEAEYLVLIDALELPIPNHVKIRIHTDSQLVYGQLTMGWRVKAINLRPLYERAYQLMQGRHLNLIKVPREVIVEKLGH